ncbi:MAG TPA: amidohydrolase family protein [Acidimicrobiales bacterium]|nr:amidohydrolase family protein [Acidimicrobiales bacterium]
MPAHPDRTLISHARVVSCSGDPTERPVDGDVLIEGDRIAGVFPGRAPVDPASVREVDVAGATVLPGLCDAHTHISWPLDFVFDHPEIAAMPEDEHALEVAAVVRTYLRWGYTLLVGAGALKPRVDVVIQRAIDRGRIDGPRLWPSGDMITQRGAIGSPTLTEVGDADQMRRAVARQCELGVRVIKLMVSGDGIVPGHPSQVTYMDDAMVGAAVREAEAHGAFVTAHARGPGGVRLAVRNGVRIVHHATYLDDDAISELTAARDDVWVCPGLHYLRAVVEGKAEQFGITRQRVEDALYPDELQASIDSLRKLHSNGVRIVAGGDFGHQWTRHGTYAAELAAYVELVGFSPLEALLTATANAGPLVGERLGRIAEGHLADLVVVDGDPTSDVRVLLDGDRVGPVVKGGVPASVPGWGGVEHWAHERRATGRAADETAPPAAGRAGDEG